MATITAASGGGNWSATATWTGGVVPGSADDVLLASTSGSVTIDTNAAACKTLDCTGYTATLTHAAGVTFTVAGTLFKLVASMTYTLGSTTTSVIAFTSTSGTCNVTTAGKTMTPTFSGAGGTWSLQDILTTNSAAPVTHTAGTLLLNGFSHSWGGYQGGSSTTRAITFGGSALTITGAAAAGWAWSTSPATNLTVSAAGSSINCTASGNFHTAAGGFTWGSVTLTLTASSGFNLVGTAGGTFANLTLNSSGTVHYSGILLSSATWTVTGTFTVAGTSPIFRVFVGTLSTGLAATISAATVSLTNADWMDITASGAAAPFTGTSMGNCLGCSNITFDASVTQTRASVAGGNWSDAAKWTSRVPLPQDDVLVPSGASGTISGDMYRLGRNVDFTGFAGTFTTAQTVQVLGDLIFSSGMTISGSGTHAINLSGRSTQSFTTGGRTIIQSVSVAAPGGTYTLTGDIVAPAAQTSVTFGTLTLNGYNVTTSAFTANAGTTINLGTSTITLTGTANGGSGGVWVAAGTVNAGTSTIVVSAASTTSRTFAGGSKTYASLTYNVANSPGALVVTGANTFTGTVTIGPGRAVTWPSSTTTTVTSLAVAGQPYGYLYLPGLTANYWSAPDSSALSITGDIDIIASVALDNWSVAFGDLVSKWGTPNFSYYLGTASGKLQLNVSPDGVTPVTAVSSVAFTATNGQAMWSRATRIAATGVVTFYTSNDPITTSPTAVNWTQLGTTVSTAVGNIFDSTGPLESNYGAGAGALAAGKWYKVAIRNGVAGTVVFNADFTAKAFGANAFVEGSTNAATVTINGAAAQVGDGRVALASSTGGTQATLSKTSGVVWMDYITAQDMKGAGGAAFYASNSANVSNNTGITFGNPFFTGTDVFSFSDSNACLSTHARSGSDSISMSDVATKITSISRSASSDAFSVVDTSSKLELLIRAGSDAIALADLVARSAAYSRTSLDSVLVSDSAAKASSFGRLAVDSFTVNDAPLRLGLFARSGLDAVSLLDNASITVFSSKSASDSIGFVDASQRAKFISRFGSDNFGVFDFVAKRMTAIRATADSVAFADSMLAAFVRARFGVDFWGVGDSLVFVMTQLSFPGLAGLSDIQLAQAITADGSTAAAVILDGSLYRAVILDA